jgi:DEAD/DEAH box helicase domain-containing protein
MIPSVLSGQVRRGIEEFLLTTFPITTPFFQQSLSELLQSDGSVFRGPYLSLKLPFRTGEKGVRYFPDVLPEGFRPHRHQERAFERLGGAERLSTLLATGTGSGKTECFLYPILDHCAREAGRRGVKAIVVYPMNALATDQAKRFAKAIEASPALKGKVTAGLYVGGMGRETHGTMGPEHVITDREAMRSSPPDILLTNYKMLDYLLIRPKDTRLWQGNEPETLQFLVVDELHTFDGAQGADLACLIRRLKARLKTPERQLCCIGTSATLGEGPEGMNAEVLSGYAAQLFGEPFEADAIVGETVETTEEFLKGHLVTRFGVPGPEAREELNPLTYLGQAEYLAAQHQLWFDEPLGETGGEEALVHLSQLLKGHAFLRNLLVILKGKARELRAVKEELARQVPGFAGADAETFDRLLGSFLALVSAARVKGPDGAIRPLVQVRLQLWLRELSRLVAMVEVPPSGGAPRLAFADDLSSDDAKRALPMVHCRECGVTGWGAVSRNQDQRLQTDLKGFYEAFFRFHPSVAFVYPDEDGSPGEQRSFTQFLCTACLRLIQANEACACPGCGAGPDVALRVRLGENTYKDREGRTHGHHSCSSCGGHNSLTIVGSRAASLTSVALSQLFASRFNDDKKLLAFSDSVQDASHRAGFFGARTYAFNFRTAVQKVVASLDEPISLPELPGMVSAWWRERLGDGLFVATFLPPDMEWLRDWEALRTDGKIPEGSDLVELVERRIAWEVWSEYTFKCRIGRTLEKSGSSGLLARPEVVEAAIAALLPALREEIGVLRSLDEVTLRRFLAGFMAALKNKGAVEQQDLGPYVESGGNVYLLHKRIHLPKFGTNTRAPAFLSSQASSRFNTLLRSSASQAPTWFEDWLGRSLSEVDGRASAYTAEIWKTVVEGLVKAGLLFQRTGPRGASIWGFPADLFLVVDRVVQMRCDRCGTNVSVAADEEATWGGACCLRYRCGGRLATEPPREDYYRSLYATGDVNRLFAEEHTGLLERPERERIEEEFKAGDVERKPGDPNLLSCTPTLEMGIDIGDLSSLALCSVPPKASNYLQRAGRAGRRDGNAFIFAVANGRPHDLFFYSEPEEMIQGLVEPPGCFLNASAVLERQLTGYVFDRWVEVGLPTGAIPEKLGPVLDEVERGTTARDAFPTNLLQYFELNRTSLEEGFLALFEEDITEHSRGRIRAFVRGSDPDVPALPFRLVDELQGVVKERKSLRNATRRLAERIEKVEAEPAGGDQRDRELSDLRQEKHALTRLVADINGKPVLNFLTDAGLLPNYAFPENGVQLKSVIYRKNEKATDAERRYETKQYVYERPAATAIVELAPASSFYAQGRKLLIDQVNVDLSKPEPWRFCAECSYMEKEGEKVLAPACPRCESPLWPDAGQKRSMLRMRQVLSTENDRDSRSYDESDDREPQFFQRNMFVVAAPGDVEAAYSLPVDGVPFGFEFFHRLTLREVNFGKRETGQTNLRIAGEDFEDTGFVVCQSCGKVKGIRKGWANGAPVSIDHALHCRYRPTPSATPPPDSQTAFKTEFLYREFDSEGIRILLPVATFDVDLKVESFVAALDLGLKKTFRGDPGHLLTTVYSEPVKGSGIRKRFLVLFDGVPGGTGYLDELMRDENGILDVLQRSMDVLASCPCQHDPVKDGCYRCLLAYRGRHDKLRTSRHAAMEILGSILRERGKITRVEQISTIPLGSLLESELEARFVEALRRSRIGDQPVQLLPHVVKGKTGWFLKCPSGNWLVEPQVELGPEEGVEVPSRADFVLHPEGGGKALPVAVFTDGFEYHADPGSPKQRLGIDTAQRLAIVRSGRYRVWSLTWDDVMECFDPKTPKLTPLGADRAPQMKRLAEMVAPEAAGDWVVLGGGSTLDLLLALLDRTKERDWAAFASAWALSFLEQGRATTLAGAEGLRDDLLGDGQRGSLEHGPEVAGSEWQTGRIERLLLGTSPVIQGLVFGRSEALGRGSLEGTVVSLRLNEIYGPNDPEGWKDAWRKFLWAMNLVQFTARSEFVTTEGLASARYGELLGGFFEEPKAKKTFSPEFESLLGHTDSALHALLIAVTDAGIEVPEAGYDLSNPAGEIVGMAEVGWEARRVAVLMPREETFRAAFEAAGWSVFVAADATGKTEAVLTALRRAEATEERE